MLNPNAVSLKPSPTLAIMMLAEKKRQEGNTVYQFGIGETNPGIKCPQLLKEEIILAIQNDETHYSPAAGDKELVEAICEDSRRNFGQNFKPENICVLPGPKDAIFKAMSAILDPLAASKGNRYKVCTFAPLYESFENVGYLLTGHEPVVIRTNPPDFYPDPEELKRVLETEPIAIVIVNSPNNPTGAVYPLSLLQQLAAIIAQYPDVWVVSDEVYRTCCYGDTGFSSIQPLLPNQTVSVAGASKEVSGTGLRIGWAAGPPHLITAIATIEGNASSCVNLPCQKGLARFLKKDADLRFRKEIVQQLVERRQVFLNKFKNAAPLAEWNVPEGAFYCFPNMQSYIGKKGTKLDGSTTPIDNDEDLCNFLLNEFGVTFLPGSKFLYPGHVRIAYCVNVEVLDKGFEQLRKALEAIH